MATYQTRSYPHAVVEAYQLAPYGEDEPDAFFEWADEHGMQYQSGRDEALEIYQPFYNRNTDEVEDEYFEVYPSQFIVKYNNGFMGMHAEAFHEEYKLTSDAPST